MKKAWNPIKKRDDVVKVFYYLTEDPKNLKDVNEIEYLLLYGRVVVVTQRSIPQAQLPKKVRILVLPEQSRLTASAYLLWMKICYLLARPSQSLTDRGFPLRNHYTGHPIIRKLINRIWPKKYYPLIQKILPDFERLYFSPFHFAQFFFQRRNSASKAVKRIIIHDALVLRLATFTPLIAMFRREETCILANVKSWDNPFYTQFIRSADGYLVWSESMWQDILRIHRPNKNAYHIWGARPFHSFSRALHCQKPKNKKKNKIKSIGYAAAYCDKLMAQSEVKVIGRIAEELRGEGILCKILLRPYPTMPLAVYEPLLNHDNVEIIEIEGEVSDRFGDGREQIRFGSDSERLNYLARCDYFLSIATSFTLEAALYGLPIFQYYLPKCDRKNDADRFFFERIDISDHIHEYFLKYLQVANNSHDLGKLIRSLDGENFQGKTSGNLMSAVGIPASFEGWSFNGNAFFENISFNDLK